ncbi:ComF family protein [Falsibacillus pallidus]|uniref:Competence protein ComFC n=1 Tax=Falsibacillus pallidus TaxID=493781 RepID=A0A370GAP7_9BACI|nr:ComF family protein [Falsibacillus pallidus]RDI40129.1 competence protein ComFC [Falsibacillus pallidus]
MSGHCLYCHEPVYPNFNWTAMIKVCDIEPFCPACQDELQLIEGERCKTCSRPQKESGQCQDCIQWEEGEWSGSLSQNHSFYVYNDFFKEVLAKYKYRGDYLISKAFSNLIKRLIKKEKPDIIAPIPLSAERLYERGFNQSEALIIEAGFQPAHLLERTHSEKQSKKSRRERIEAEQVFRLNPECATIIEKKSILLIDDIYTTGATLRHAAKVLKDNGAKKVSSLTIARSI